jgi:hypothetical protein
MRSLRDWTVLRSGSWAHARAEAEYDVPDLLPTSLDELNLVFCPFGEVGKEACVRALARQLPAGKLTPRELVSRVHLPVAERLAELDDEYDVLDYGDRTLMQVDAEVTDAARRLAAMPAPGSADGPPWPRSTISSSLPDTQRYATIGALPDRPQPPHGDGVQE